MAERKRKRNVSRDALIGTIAGVVAGMSAAALTHPIDTHMTAAQSGHPKRYSMLKAPFKKEMWRGVGGSAVKKGLSFGIGLGVSAAVASALKNLLDNKGASLSKLKFKKYDNS